MAGSLVIQDNEPVQRIQREELIAQKTTKTAVIDLQVCGLPASTDERSLTKESGATHVVSCEPEVDNVKGECTGTARLSYRSNSPEEKRQVKRNLIARGYMVKDRTRDNRKPRNYLDTHGTSWLNPATTIETEKGRLLSPSQDDRMDYSVHVPLSTRNTGRKFDQFGKIGQEAYRERRLNLNASTDNVTMVAKQEMLGSQPDLFGNTNGTHQRKNVRRLKRDRSRAHNAKVNRTMHDEAIWGWKQTEKRVSSFAEHRALSKSKTSCRFMQPTKSSKLKRAVK